jgi:hypothetical protein
LRRLRLEVAIQRRARDAEQLGRLAAVALRGPQGAADRRGSQRVGVVTVGSRRELLPDAGGRVTTAPIVEMPVNVTGTVDIAVGPDGDVWFTSFFGDTIGYATPDGTVVLFPLPGSSPSGLTAAGGCSRRRRSACANASWTWGPADGGKRVAGARRIALANQIAAAAPAPCALAMTPSSKWSSATSLLPSVPDESSDRARPSACSKSAARTSARTSATPGNSSPDRPSANLSQRRPRR